MAIYELDRRPISPHTIGRRRGCCCCGRYGNAAGLWDANLSRVIRHTSRNTVTSLISSACCLNDSRRQQIRMLSSGFRSLEEANEWRRFGVFGFVLALFQVRNCICISYSC